MVSRKSHIDPEAREALIQSAVRKRQESRGTVEGLDDMWWSTYSGMIASRSGSHPTNVTEGAQASTGAIEGVAWALFADMLDRGPGTNPETHEAQKSAVIDAMRSLVSRVEAKTGVKISDQSSEVSRER